MINNEDAPLLDGVDYHQHALNGDQQQFRTYKSRYYVLFLFTLVSLQQCNQWITFSTVAPLSSTYYNSPIALINFLSAVGPIIFVPFSIVMTWSINRYGIRKNIMISAGLVALGSVIRSIPGQGNKLFPLIVIGQVFNSVAGPVVMILPTKISATWFAPSERTFSTAIGTLSNFSGSAIAFIVSLYAVDGLHLRYLLFAEATFSILIFAAVCIYFPEKPPSPPSATSFISDIKSQTPLGSSGDIYQPQSLLQSWKTLFVSSYQFMTNSSAAIVTIAVALTSGTYAGWSAVLTEILLDVYTIEQGKMFGFYGILAGIVGGLMCGFAHDRFHNFKKILLFLFAINTIIYLLFSLMVDGYIPRYYWLGQLLNVSGGWVINGFYPIIYEAAVEVSYPIPESIGTSIISILLNVVTFIAIMVGSVVPVYYLNYFLVATSLISFLLIFFVKEEYKRSKNDNLIT
ncbi:hypothetical protein DFA_01681 [Cavenderia fasciculata]|uniref:Major facilitator superfamily (MFS) profile domain-containing protein n=1 Tax=Cavenderia fasciculata TaxID=261658 RepID=F4PU80_CACFS|nr:uncharacterized protein DFA_01681 [Cavenderia fasciculata]EGG21795.1 hypothetical protein DFA_01681 [Cavenderia fasciculata]|eukprot:XP_004359645.1 hypothetical protein DFA_01681 [Cavenderia fasciculata]